jgi:GNAT superfamily N-acetyltransferase
VLQITDALARRLESAEAIDAAGCAEAQCQLDLNCGAAVLPVAGGVAVFCGTQSPLTHSIGIGMNGPVTAEELDELEDFYRIRGAPVVIDLCPHAHLSLRDLLCERHYRIIEFVNVMVWSGTPASSHESPLIEVRRTQSDDDDLYVRTVIGGFFSREALTPEEFQLGMTLFHMPCTSGYLAWVNDQAAGGGSMSIRNKVASFFGDATLPAFRGRGIHLAMIRERIRCALESGCDLIAAGTLPGSGSQRNYERSGFQIAYTKTTMALQ